MKSSLFAAPFNRLFADILFFITAVIISGCTENLRPYRLWENNQFQHVQVPTKNDIKSEAIHKTIYPYPIDKVRQACLHIAVQGAGVLGVRADSKRNYRLLFVASVAQQRNFGYLSKFAGRFDLDFIEAWIAVDIEEISDVETEVAAAWASPDGKVKNAFVTGYGISGKEMELATMANTAMTSYLDAVGNQLEGDSKWKKLLSPVIPEKPLRAGPAAEKVESPPWAEYSIPYGNYLSAMTKTQYYCIENPELVRHIEDIAHLLLAAANTKDGKIAAYIISSNKENAFASPNGDIFITTAQLDDLSSSDELAAILAHELDHVIQKDGVTRLKKQYETTNLKFYIFSSAVIVAVTSAVLYDPDFWFASSKGKQNYIAPALGVAALFGGAAIGILSAAETGEILDRDYSIAQEFRADRNATIYLWRAGFDHTSWLKILEKRRIGGVPFSSKIR